MKTNALTLVALCALAVALALPAAGGIAATPTVTQANGRDVELLSVAGTDSGPPADSSCDSIVAALT